MSTEDVEELLDTVDKTLDRLKTLYEQYFLGIQKQAPAYIHSDVERKLRDIMQLQIRNTGLRYRFTSIQAKFAAYNSYWRRTLRQIENGTYIRNLSKIGRQAAKSGADIPEEILAAMPKRMREQVLKDREAALASARRHHQVEGDELLDLAEEPAFIKEGTDLRRQVRGAHVLKDEGDFDIDAFFKEVEGQAPDDKTPEDQPPVHAPPPRASQPAADPRSTMLGVPPVPGPPPSQPAMAARPSQPAIPTARPSQPAMAARPSQPAIPGAQDPRSTMIGVPVIRATPRPDTDPGLPPDAAAPILRPPPGPVPPAATSPGFPAVPPPRIPTAPSQAARPNPIAPGSAAAHGDAPVESMAGPFARPQTGPVPRMPNPNQTGPVPRMPTGSFPNETGPVPRMPTGPLPNQTGAVPRTPTGPFPNQTGAVPRTPTGPFPNPNATGPVPRQPNPDATGPIPVQMETGPFPRIPTGQVPTATGPVPRTPTGPVPNPNATGPVPNPNATGPMPRMATGPVPRVPTNPGATGAIPRSQTGPVPRPPGAPRPAPPVSAQSQPTRPTPSAAPAEPGMRPPAGMSDADVNALYAKYVKAKESVGEHAGPGAYGKLLKTINQQAPKIMEQYKAKGVDFSVVVKDNQVIIRAKPKP
jgi:hypothetical protein